MQNLLPPLIESSTIALIKEEDSVHRLHKGEYIGDENAVKFSQNFNKSQLLQQKSSALHNSVQFTSDMKQTGVDYYQPTPLSVLKVHAMPSKSSRNQSLIMRHSERSGSQNSVGVKDSLVIKRLSRKAKLPALNSTQIGLSPAASPHKSFRLSDRGTISVDKRIANNFQVTIKQN